MTTDIPRPSPHQLNTVLVVGATGSIGRLAVAESIASGFRTRALVRDRAKATRVLPATAEIVVGDVTEPESLTDAVDEVDAVVLTLGSDGAGRQGAESVDYAGVRNVLAAIGTDPVRVALMTAIGVTDRESAYNQQTQAHDDWKRRSERLVRPAAMRTRSCDLVGSTTTTQTSTSCASCRATPGTPATPVTG